MKRGAAITMVSPCPERFIVTVPTASCVVYALLHFAFCVISFGFPGALCSGRHLMSLRWRWALIRNRMVSSGSPRGVLSVKNMSHVASDVSVRAKLYMDSFVAAYGTRLPAPASSGWGELTRSGVDDCSLVRSSTPASTTHLAVLKICMEWNEL